MSRLTRDAGASLLRVYDREHLARAVHKNDEQLAQESLGAQERHLRGIQQTIQMSPAGLDESYDDVANAIDREKQLKRWNRTKKEWLISHKNPTWEDLAAEWYIRPQADEKKLTELQNAKRQNEK